MGKTIEFARPDGKTAPGYLVESPSGSNAPGVVMLEEWWGITEYIKETAAQLAAGGFRVLVPDLYRGRTTADRDEANHLMEGLDFGDAATQDARGAAQFLRSDGRKTGVMGFCMGGALTLLCAMFDPEFSAAVTVCGYPPAEAGDPASITIPVQGHWATEDAFFPIDYVDRLEKRFEDAKVPHEFYRYKAKHAFTNPHQPGDAGLGHYDREHAEAVWSRTIAFFTKHLD